MKLDDINLSGVRLYILGTKIIIINIYYELSVKWRYRNEDEHLDIIEGKKLFS